MKQTIEEALKKMCSNSRANVNSETGRGYIAEAVLTAIDDNHNELLEHLLSDKIGRLEASNLALTVEVAELRDELHRLGGDLPVIDENVKNINKLVNKQWSKINND